MSRLLEVTSSMRKISATICARPRGGAVESASSGVFAVAKSSGLLAGPGRR